jgi:hypothetical protein
MWRFRQWYKDELKARRRSLRFVARAIGYTHNASRLSEYLSGKRVPGPEKVREMAEAIDASPLLALWIAGYRDAVLGELSALYKLGWLWCREDGMVLDSGVALTPFLDQHLVNRYHTATIYQTAEGPHPIASKVMAPWPWAIAILISIGMFPRRGDIPVTDLFERLSTLATLAGPLVRAARKLKMPDNFAEPDGLRTAAALIPKAYLGLSGSAIVGEYVSRWAEQVDRPYVAYARLVLFTQIGCIGFDEKHGLHWLEDHKRAEFPSEAELKAMERATN